MALDRWLIDNRFWLIFIYSTEGYVYLSIPLSVHTQVLPLSPLTKCLIILNKNVSWHPIALSLSPTKTNPMTPPAKRRGVGVELLWRMLAVQLFWWSLKQCRIGSLFTSYVLHIVGMAESLHSCQVETELGRWLIQITNSRKIRMFSAMHFNQKKKYL